MLVPTAQLLCRSRSNRAVRCARWKAQPLQLEEWKAWFKEQADLANAALDRGLYISLRLDGRVRGSGLGPPPWARLVAQLAPTEGAPLLLLPFFTLPEYPLAMPGVTPVLALHGCCRFWNVKEAASKCARAVLLVGAGEGAWKGFFDGFDGRV